MEYIELFKDFLPNKYEFITPSPWTVDLLQLLAFRIIGLLPSDFPPGFDIFPIINENGEDLVRVDIWPSNIQEIEETQPNFYLKAAYSEIIRDTLYLYYRLSPQDVFLMRTVKNAVEHELQIDHLKMETLFRILAGFMRGSKYIAEVDRIEHDYPNPVTYNFYFMSLMQDLLKEFPFLSNHLGSFLFYLPRRLLTIPNALPLWSYLDKHPDLAEELIKEYQPPHKSIPSLLLNVPLDELNMILDEYEYGVDSEAYLEAVQHWNSLQ